MSAVNEIKIVGRAGGEPELRVTPKGDSVANFSVAVTPRIFRDQKWEDGDPTWFRVNAWGSLGENAAESIKKGDWVMVFGALDIRDWEDKEGNKRQSTEIRADHVGISLRFDGAESRREAGGSRSSKPKEAPAPKFNPDEEPF